MSHFNIDYRKTDYASVFLRNALGRPEPDVYFGRPLYSDAEIAAYLAKIPSPAELQTAYETATERDGPAAKIKGVLWGVDYAGPDVRHKSAAFRPDAKGDMELWCEPWRDASGVIRDLIWRNDDGCGEWGFSTGLASLFGAELLKSRVYTEADALPVTDCPMAWADEGRNGVCLLTLSARALLRPVAFVRCDTFDLMEVIAARVFEHDTERCFGPADPAELQCWLEQVGQEELAAAEWLELRRIARGGDPAEKLPVELMA
jgi:hypothetical protein